MKNFFRITFVVLFVTRPLFVMASMEHISGHEAVVSDQKLFKQRSCFKVIQEYGCVHPREDQVLFRTCLAATREKLSLSCRSFFTKLYGE